MGDSVCLLEDAVAKLAASPGITLDRLSSIYKTEPQDDPGQPWFFNQVARIVVTLSANDLLSMLQRIENQLGRVRNERRFGPRTMDLDMLLYGNSQINETHLVIPHPRMCERAFVLLPLQEIEPDLVLPDGNTVTCCLEKLDYILTGDKIWQKL